jgi:hypothetical protein
MRPARDGEPDLSRLADLTAALAEHVVDLDRRAASLETGSAPPKRVAASDLRRIAKQLMALSLLRRRRLRRSERKP